MTSTSVDALIRAVASSLRPTNERPLYERACFKAFVRHMLWENRIHSWCTKSITHGAVAKDVAKVWTVLRTLG